jgi:hypothetical protein
MSLKDSGEVDISAIEYADEMYSITTLPTQVTKRNYSNFSSSFFTPVASNVPAPTALVVTNTPINGLPGMTVSFTAPSAADIIDYIIEYQENGNVQQQVTTSTTTLVTGLKNQVTYTVRVYSRNSQGRISPALE